jgi:4-hydroxy-2-oxoheptanedioate aldolase
VKNTVLRNPKPRAVSLVAGGVNDPAGVDLLGSLGIFDTVWLETEHGPTSWGELGDLSRAADLWGMSSVVRVQHNEPTFIARSLGEGVDGIIIPHVDSRDQAERVVQAAKFAPIGQRGADFGRKSFHAQDWFAQANDMTFIVAMIESIAAVEALPDILAVSHIDVFFVSHFDLAQSMGMLQRHHSAEVTQVIDSAIAQIVDAGRGAGVAVTQESVEKYLDLGATWLKVPAVQVWIRDGARSFARHVDRLLERAT